MSQASFQVKQKLVGKRLDLAIVETQPKLSRRKVKSLIDAGLVYVNGQKTRIASKALSFGDQVLLEHIPAAKAKKSVTLDRACILYRQHGLIVINKPPGLPTQGTKASDKFQVIPVLNKLLSQWEPAAEELYLVHRLDKETSGVLVLAETKTAQDFLVDQFRQRTTEKFYEAICHGHSKDQFSVSCLLSAINPKSGMVRASMKSGKDSLTHFNTMERAQHLPLSLVRCQPITGRSHQIRVHLARTQHPILGDKVYGHQKNPLPETLQELASDHHLLHARTLSIVPAPNMSPIKIKAPYPQNFRDALALLRGQGFREKE